MRCGSVSVDGTDPPPHRRRRAPPTSRRPAEHGSAEPHRPPDAPRTRLATHTPREDLSMGDSFYAFHSTWQVSAPPDDVYKVLERLPDYPLWWPQVKTVRPRGDDAYELTCRASLPYDLVFVTSQSKRDPDARILEANITGDLEGF